MNEEERDRLRDILYRIARELLEINPGMDIKILAEQIQDLFH